MARKTPRGPVPIRVRRRPDGLLSLHAIRRLARAIAERFDPERIILFGSYAYGQPDKESDVDLLVVMPAYSEWSKATRIQEAIDIPIPWDLIVRTPERLERRLRWGDQFLQEIVTRGKVLYAKSNGRLGAKGGKRLSRGTRSVAKEKADP